jgi:hypothetical protein
MVSLTLTLTLTLTLPTREGARARPGLDCAADRKAPRPFLISGPASQSIPGWNQIMEWLREVQRIREIAGEAAA